MAGTRLFVGNVPGGGSEGGGGTEARLRESFGAWGAVQAVELKSKPGSDAQFAFVTLAAGPLEVEACIRHFAQEDWNGSKLYVTRARESFLERLQKEREQALTKKQISEETFSQETSAANTKLNVKVSKITTIKSKKEIQEKVNGFHNDTQYESERTHTPNKHQTLKKNENLPNKFNDFTRKTEMAWKTDIYQMAPECSSKQRDPSKTKEKFTDEKKRSADAKRLESMKKMRKEFNEKKLHIKTGLAGVDKVCNKRIKFSDVDEYIEEKSSISEPAKKPLTAVNGKGKSLFDDEDDNEGHDDVSFKIKEQFEGKKGQKVLELQSRYKSDKRFTLDERFIEEEEGTGEAGGLAEPMNVEEDCNDEEVQVPNENEKLKQLNILENVLGVAIKRSKSQPEPINDAKKTKSKMGMLRFDPNHPDHAKYLAPKEDLHKVDNSKKKKSKRKDEITQDPGPVVEKVEVSKEQFYKVSDTLKEAIAQPNSFSLRSLFSKADSNEDETDRNQDTGHIALSAPKRDKVRNPLEPGSKNPFKYDSSDSEPEPEDEVKPALETDVPPAEDNKTKAVWREKLFFSRFDNRFKEGLAFFNNTEASVNKERRELKVLMKKRLHNRSRKDQMFQKKIGGRRKTFNKNRKRTH